MFALLAAASGAGPQNVEEKLAEPKHSIAILDCGPMMNDCNKLQDGGGYY
jgi:hypothetical protein